ncbi:MAG: T9SS type A sorting domain-containing protein [Bacteroidia bacterium]
MKHVCKSIIVLGLLMQSYNSYSQDIKSPYFNNPILTTNDLEIPSNSSDAINNKISWHRSSNLSGYTGEYEIVLNNNWLTWAWYEDHVPLAQSITLFYEMEIVSFPFTPDCYQNSAGCLGQSSRNFVMPFNSTPYSNDSWGPIYRKEPVSRFGQQHQSLASLFYKDNFPIPPPGSTVQPRYVLPHTVIKHTVYVHCEDWTTTNLTPTTPWAAKISWIYDNTRGRMKYYPFCACNCSACASMLLYDVAFYPHLLHKSNHQFNETSPTAVSTIGVLDYYPYSEINQNILCTKPIIIPPANADYFDLPGGFGYNKVYPPPYSLVSAPLYQFRGRIPAGYDFVNFSQITGMLHTYNIQNNIDLVATEISHEDRIIYNPSDVYITAPALVFPSHYSFRTIRGLYPTPIEVSNDDTPENGGPYPDPRDVPVRTDLRSEDPAFPHDEAIPEDSRYASLYRLKNGSKITIEPCVNIFDAAFILETGSTLVYENYLTQKGYYPDNLSISRVAIDRNGGRLVRQYDNSLPNATLYLQHQTEVATAPNSYIVDEKILAGSNVDPGQQAGPYIASSGSALELIAKNYVKLADGFEAHAGAEVKIAVDPAMSIPACPPVPPTQSNNNRMLNPQIEQADPSLAKAVLSPNPVQQQTIVSLLQSGNENFIQRLQLHDARGQLLFSKENLSTTNDIIDVSGMTDGIYLLTVTTNHQTEVLKLVVNKTN